MSKLVRVIVLLVVALMLDAGAWATTSSSATKRRSAGTAHVSPTGKARTAKSTRAKTKTAATKRVSKTTITRKRGRGARTQLAVRRSRYREHFSASSFADNLTLGDVTDGEDPVVRAAAIEALGNMNGTAVAIDPSNGRILAMVNQKLALSRGAEPCSTIKLTVALAALEEGIVKRDTPVNLGGRYRLTLTEALAHSNNAYFETIGRTLGFERVKHYANEFGLGELAGYNIQGEQLGVYPDEELPAKLGGVGRMCSFGESVSMTPLQLGALVSAIANGGTLYYLQHPENAIDIASFEPRVKRQLNIAPLIPEMLDGMQGAVMYGTARSLRASFNEFPVMGKTGTCSNNGTRFGWFGSYADTPNGRIVTVFFLEGGRPTFGPKAAELTGQFYRALWDKSYFTPKSQQSAGVTTLGASE
ncbi:penicillin-binding transpeptidase domain-containing protein [Edaphobacter aggregans]|uniref:penicillin-binding transpeptidase domain-containing protein n=1 Tax=Edaphobacter aggregans TaxID=570835 RepID=UPI000556570F|nr:penicillin-binding transpeptidase domain-containing protein [Edaphobacter aggregans]